jgi:hypothetical protein
MSCPGEILCVIGVINIFLFIIMMFSPHFAGPGGEVHVTGGGLVGIFLGIIWIVMGLYKIYDRRRIQREQEIAERIPTLSCPANEDDSPVAILPSFRHDRYSHTHNSCPPRNMALQRKIQQGTGNYHKIIPARTVVDGGLEQSSHRVEELVNYGPRFSFAAVAKSVEMTTIKARQLKQEQQDVKMLAEQQGMSSLDKENNQEQDENEIV